MTDITDSLDESAGQRNDRPLCLALKVEYKPENEITSGSFMRP